MTRMCVPQAACAGITVDGAVHRARGGMLDVPDHLAGRFAMAGCFPASTPPRAPGFVCVDCGFHALIKTCGRCGGRCERPGGAHDGIDQAV